MRLAVAASGPLGLQCIGSLPGDIKLVCVLTDASSSGIREWCSLHKIPCFCGNPRGGKVNELIHAHAVDVLFSINYIFLLDAPILSWPRKFSLNIHGSLLPRYRGRTPHVWAIINNESYTGLTVHVIDEDCDAGDVVYQQRLAISPEMTGGDVLKWFEREYPLAVAHVLQMITRDTIRPQAQDHSKATYYGKRTPADGGIDWNWQKERIQNWVRAQARPYPGAFSFYKGVKVVIHGMSVDDAGYHYDDINGKILNVVDGQPVVKTSNGAVRLRDFEVAGQINFKSGEHFHG